MRKAFMFRILRFLNDYNYTVKNMVHVKVHKVLQFSRKVVLKSGCTYLHTGQNLVRKLPIFNYKAASSFIAIIQCDGLGPIDGSGETADGFPHLVEAAWLKWLPLFKVRVKNHQQNEKQSLCLFYWFMLNIIKHNFEAISQLLKMNKANWMKRCIQSVSMSLALCILFKAYFKIHWVLVSII